MSEMVDLRPIKEAVLKLENNAVKDVILAEPDSLPFEEYLAKASTWARLLRAKKETP